MRLAIAGLVRSIGFEAAIYASAEDFLATEDYRSARCIITDIQMAGLSGIELKRRLTADGCAAPVIMITARSERQLQDQAKACGAFCFLKKPFEISDLIGCLGTGPGRLIG
ncbi:MAG: response regulator [Caulobacteraceae bacterium]